MSPRWILAVLERELPELDRDARVRLARALTNALPGHAIASAIAQSPNVVLAERQIGDPDRLAREVGNNAAQGVLAALWEA